MTLKPQKSSFFSGPATKALPPSSLVATFFGGFFFELQKSSFSLVVCPLRIRNYDFGKKLKHLNPNHIRVKYSLVILKGGGSS